MVNQVAVPRRLQGRPALVPHGGLVYFPCGHVLDLVRAMVLAAEHPAAGGEIVNITAEAVTANHYIRIIAKMLNVEPNIVSVPDEVLVELCDPLPFNHGFQKLVHSVLSTEKAQRVLGFTPSFDFEAGHRQTYEWFQAAGLERLATPTNDPVWNISWDFSRESALLARLNLSA